MRVWRISNFADLSGAGGILAPGRWHSRGSPIVYTSEHPALALLEVLVHFERTEMPEHYQLLGIDIADVDVEPAELPGGWADNVSLTRAVGDAWLRSGRSLLLQVPSVLVPHGWNYLLNPRRPAFRSAVIASRDLAPFDARLG